jgi:hypothetical protein
VRLEVRKRVEVRPNWKEQPVQPSLTGKVWRIGNRR